MPKPILIVGTPVRVICDVATWSLRAGDLGTISLDLGVNTFRVSVHTCHSLQEPGNVHLYGVEFADCGLRHRYILCDEEIEPVDKRDPP